MYFNGKHKKQCECVVKNAVHDSSTQPFWSIVIISERTLGNRDS